MWDGQQVRSFGPGVAETLGGVLEKQGLGVFADDDETESEGEDADFFVVTGGEEVGEGVEGCGEAVDYGFLG